MADTENDDSDDRNLSLAAMMSSTVSERISLSFLSLASSSQNKAQSRK